VHSGFGEADERAGPEDRVLEEPERLTVEPISHILFVAQFAEAPVPVEQHYDAIYVRALGANGVQLLLKLA
jgi:hypothetical protein